MARILLFVVLAFLCWFVIRLLGSARKRDDASSTGRSPDVPPIVSAVESVTQCAWCGVHVPRGEAVALPDGRVYCSRSHRDAARDAVVPAATPSDRDRT